VRIEIDDSGLKKVFIRQSWLNDALMCPERARLVELHPESRRENDSAVLGTAVHKGIEGVLREDIQPNQAGEFAKGWFHGFRGELQERGTDINITNVDPDRWLEYIDSMSAAWVRDIYPSLPLGGLVEHKFCQPMAIVEGLHDDESSDWALYFEGTIDYIHAEGIWDWKTAGRKYYEAEKQSRDIQSAVYAGAMAYAEMLEHPTAFTFGVMIRSGNSTGQTVTVTRTQAHTSWVMAQAAGLVNSLMLLRDTNPEASWVRNDQHHLCSERWCPVWSKCKGALMKGIKTAEEANNG
jgi:hypothetical protein